MNNLKNSFYLSLVSTLIPVNGLLALSAQAETPVYDVTYRISEQTNQVALVPFAGDTGLSQIISQDLNGTTLATTSDNLPQQAHSIDEVANSLLTWQQTGIPYVVVGNVNNNRVDFEVIDVVSGASIGGKQSIALNRSNTRNTAHQVANRIYQLITGKQGDFAGRIAYIEEIGTGASKTSNLVVMDTDGENKHIIDQIKGNMFTPAWTPDGKYIAYSKQQQDGYPVIYLINANGGNPQPLTPRGTSMSPSFSPDGSKMIFSFTNYNSANAEIHQLNLPLSHPPRLKQLTALPSNEITPSYAPDGHSFVFVSDKLGENNPAIYRFSNGSISKLSSSRYATNPVYSPDGSMIAFLNGTNATIMNNNGQVIQNLGKTGVDGSASFSPNSKRVVYAVHHGGNGSINIKSLDEGQSYSIPITGKALSPVWSVNQ